METAHDKESSLSPKLTMSMNFYFQTLFQTDKYKWFQKFIFVCELLPFLKDSLFSDENTIIIALVKTFQML